MILAIDTTQANKVLVSLRDEHSTIAELEKANQFGSQATTLAIEELLLTQGKTKEDLTAIEVNNQAGSYTGTRVGVAIAHALGYVLGIPVNGKIVPKEIVNVEYVQ